MPRLTRKLPSYRLHKPSGQAIVTLDGKDFYLGPHGTRVSRSEYDRLIAEWLAHGRRLPPAQDPSPDLAINDLILRYWRVVADEGVVGSGRLGRTGRPAPE